MFKNILWVHLIISINIFTGACGSSDSKSTSNTDGNTNNKDGGGGSSNIDANYTSTNKDQNISVGKDGISDGVKKDRTSGADASLVGCGQPVQAKTNSGKLCDLNNKCPAGEECIIPTGGTKGICLGVCCPDAVNPDSDFNLCPVANSDTQYSECFLSLDDDKTYTCGWACYYKDEQGNEETFKCPNDTDYDCKAAFKNEDGSWDETLKICLPKQ